MASKSKRRGRVFRASCILAALIIAGSSFAWFTSSDEVTNRLSANADYDVSIVESFAPPKNWLPGADVDKDVYAVNTGSIGAFVEEQITSKITITKEEKVANFDAATCIKLTPAERYSIEAGSFLALKPADSANEVGNQIVSFGNGLDNEGSSPAAPTTLQNYTADTVVTDFYPKAVDGEGKKATGLYVFRRVINTTNSKDETFEYEGYYYDQDTDSFYKVELESLTPDTVADIADDGKDTDGILTGATYSLFKETTTVHIPTLKYDADKAWLIATVPGSTGPTDAKLKELADAYDAAIHEYQRALAAYSNAVAENTDATATEKEKLDDYNNAIIDEAKKEKKYKEELANLQAIQKQLKDAISERDNSTNGLKKRRDDALKALIGDVSTLPDNVDDYLVDETRTDLTTKKKPGTKTSGTDYNTSSLYKELIDAYNAIPSTLTDNDKLEFYHDLTTEAQRLKGDGAANFNSLPFALGADYSEDNLNKLIDAFTYQQLKDYADASFTDNHDTFGSIATYAAKLKDYQTKLATFNQLNTELNNLNTRIGAGADSGLQGSFKTKYTEVYGTTAYSNYYNADTNHDYVEDVKTTGESPVLSSVTKDDKDTYDSRVDYYGDLLDARADKLAAEDAYNKATAAVNTDDPNTAQNLKDAEAAKAKAAAQLATAKKTYEDAQKAYDEAGDIIINIKLVKDNVVTNGGTAEKWQLLPIALEDTDSNNTKDTATFYYTSILDGGKTSKQLVDSVELDSSVTQDMYKSFDFDLDVKLKSAQMLYADDNKTILPTAVNGDGVNEGQLDANVTLADPTNPATALTWSAK